MIIRYFSTIIGLISLGCGIIDRATAPNSEVPSNGIPAKPWPNQLRPGKDGKCLNPSFKVLNAGCWVQVKVDLDACGGPGRPSYFAVHDGACYYPVLDFPPSREPTSRTERFTLEGP